MEVEQWVTGTSGKESGRYLGLDFRTEIETGLTVPAARVRSISLPIITA